MRGQEAREILYDVPHELNELVRIRRLWLAINSCLEPLWQFIKQTAEKARLLAFDLEHASVVHATEEQRWRNLADATLPNFVAINRGGYSSGYLGSRFQPLNVLDPNRGVDELRCARQLLERVPGSNTNPQSLKSHSRIRR